MKFLFLSLFLNNTRMLKETSKMTIKKNIFRINTSERSIESTRYSTQGIINAGITTPTALRFITDEVIFLSEKSSICSILKNVKWGL